MQERFQCINKTITIVGLGLLGGSYAMALKKAGNTVYGIDIQEKSIEYALNHNYIDKGLTSNFEDFLEQSDIVVLCLYPENMLSWIERYAKFIKPNTLITDVCGVKSNFIDKAQEILSQYNIEFYASHPMRGKEVLGIENADSAMFKNANLILCPTEKNTLEAEEKIIALGKTLGFSVFPKLSPKEHDSMIAYLSQLTHVIAVCLMTSRDTEDFVKYSGDSFRDLTRIANIDEYLWSELFITNKDLLCNEIDLFAEKMLKLKDMIKYEKKDEMMDLFRLSSKNRKNFNKKNI